MFFKLELEILRMNKNGILARLTVLRNKANTKFLTIALGFIVAVSATGVIAQVARTIPAPEIDVTSYILMDQNNLML